MHSRDYETCEKTYATLRIYSSDIDPDEVTARLGIEPSEVQRQGELRGCGRFIRVNAWFLSSKDNVNSTDLNEHLEWLLDQVLPHEEALRELRDSGIKTDVACYWLSLTGNGGPTLFPEQMGKLAILSLDCWFDVYFAEQQKSA